MGSPRCYTTETICELLDLPPRTFYQLKAAGDMPFLEELKPRIGRRARYRADLIDRYLDNKFNVRGTRRLA